MTAHSPSDAPPDRLNELGVLNRREIEARILAPMLAAFSQEFDRQHVLEIARQVIVEIARQQGAQLAQALGGNDLRHFAASLENWKKDDAMQVDVLPTGAQQLHFNVTRCRYAEMYRSLGVPELGALLSCNRDQALIQGFNPQVSLTRTHTLMEGAAFCDFRFEMNQSGEK